MINIKWFGHSMWKIWTEEISIITDPFADIGYKVPANETADIILSSHDHFDHNNTSIIKGDPRIFNQPGLYRQGPVDIQNIAVWHDNSKGSQRGANLLMKFKLEGFYFLHCGDLGHIPGNSILKELGTIDVLFVPIGGFYTIDALQAKKLIDLLSPTIIFPMHYKTAVLDFPIADEKPFKKIIRNSIKISDNQICLNAADLKKPKTIFLDYA